ncbi:MAG: hypothetical protein DMG84_22795 [Acidobacteria bacterium]|nr:MAG: hypothetical protein DMG84_22795 [Acidobacteriota bacterium]
MGDAPSARDLVRCNDRLCEQFIRLCGDQVCQRGEILLDIDSTDDPTHGQQQLSFFNGGYGQHMYHPMLIFERHPGCLLAARLRPGNASSHARIVPMLLRLVPRLQSAFPGVTRAIASRQRLAFVHSRNNWIHSSTLVTERTATGRSVITTGQCSELAT